MRSVLEAIRLGRWKEEIEWYRQETDPTERETVKKRFPGVTFSGVFKERRLDRNLIHYNDVMVIDIDKKDMDMSFGQAMECLQMTPFVFCAFESPSYGIKALAYSDMGAENHKAFFQGVEEYMDDKYGIKVDASGKNPGRLCFISYDPNMYFNTEDRRPFNLESDAPKTFTHEKNKEFTEVKNIDLSQYENSYDVKFIMEVAKKRVVKGVGAYHKGNRNNFVFYMGCIFSDAGIDKQAAIDIIYSHYSSLGTDEVKSTVSSAYRHCVSDFGSRPIMTKKNNQSKMI